jgi:hypothetical protein
LSGSASAISFEDFGLSPPLTVLTSRVFARRDYQQQAATQIALAVADRLATGAPQPVCS